MPDLATASARNTQRNWKYPGALKRFNRNLWPRNSPKTFRTIRCAVLRISRFAAVVQDPKKTAELLAAHYRHLLWQLGPAVSDSMLHRPRLGGAIQTPAVHREYGVLLEGTPSLCACVRSL